jgi:hypothetical protein
VNRGAALGGALLVTLATPATWPLAMAAFLLRGGIVLVALPIVVLPTPVGLGTALGPTLTAVALGSVPGEAVALTGALVVGALAWLIAGGWLAAALEAEGIRIVAVEATAASPVTSPASGAVTPATRTAARILAARLIANIPLGLALSWGSIRLVGVSYDELTSPLDVATPVVLRVLRDTPDVVGAIVLAWMSGEIVGAMAARRIALAGEGVAVALRLALATCVRDPLSAFARFWLPTLALVVVLAPSAVASASAGNAAGAVLGDGADPIRILVAVLSLVLMWSVGLLLAAVVCAWRSAVWTVAEVTRKRTFGGSVDRRPGDWRPDRRSATL